MNHTSTSSATINGVALHGAGQSLSAEALRERAYTELLRQTAVQGGLLPRCTLDTAPELDAEARQVIEAMLEHQVATPLPSEDECQRYFAACQRRFRTGQAMLLRHILFAVTPGVNVQLLATHAEKVLLRLMARDGSAATEPPLFATLAQENSNCPSAAEGGMLGWVGPQDCVPELADALFFGAQACQAVGMVPRLLHTRFGLHVVEVLEQRPGTLPSYADVRERVAAQLALQSRAKALQQYMRLLVGQAHIEGLVLDGADSPLLQ